MSEEPESRFKRTREPEGTFIKLKNGRTIWIDDSEIIKVETKKSRREVHTFSKRQARKIRNLLKTPAKHRTSALRKDLRNEDFYIEEFKVGMTPEDFDRFVEEGRTIISDDVSPFL